jgi:hypothetical protein
MRPLVRASVVGVVGFGLLGDPASAQPKADPSLPSPQQSTTAQGKPSNDSSGTGEGSSTPPAPTAGAAKEGADASSSATTGGYSWREKPVTHRPVPKFRIDPSRPLVQAPTFEMLADGRSRVTLAVSQKVVVERHDKGTTVTFALRTAQVGVANNLNPLVTKHFPSPLLRAQLRREKSQVSLQLELSSVVPITHAVREGPDGGMILVVTLAAGRTGATASPDARVKAQAKD